MGWHGDTDTGHRFFGTLEIDSRGSKDPMHATPAKAEEVKYVMGTYQTVASIEQVVQDARPVYCS